MSGGEEVFSKSKTLPLKLNTLSLKAREFWSLLIFLLCKMLAARAGEAEVARGAEVERKVFATSVTG